MVSGTGHNSHVAGVSRDRCILRSLLHGCGFTFRTSPTNVGSFHFPRAKLTMSQVQKFCGVLTQLHQFPLGRHLSGEALTRLQQYAGTETGEALTPLFKAEYDIYYRVSKSNFLLKPL